MAGVGLISLQAMSSSVVSHSLILGSLFQALIALSWVACSRLLDSRGERQRVGEKKREGGGGEASEGTR